MQRRDVDGVEAAAIARVVVLEGKRVLDVGCGEVGHPIVRSAEPNEDWSSCFLDEVALIADAGRDA
jgi:ubiquinone/menaquinone biosynthesis C-methylase UbiE